MFFLFGFTMIAPFKTPKGDPVRVKNKFAGEFLIVILLALPVILRDDLLCHVLAGVWLLDPGKPEVADLEHTVAVHQ